MGGARARGIVRALALTLAAVAAAAGCRAAPSTPGDDLGVDQGVPPEDLGGADLGAPDLTLCAPGPEVCSNGCDDDRNGYVDADDPACTTQLLVTLDVQTPKLWRMILEPQPHLVALDGNPVPGGGMAEYNRAFSPSAYLAFDGSTKLLRRLVLDGGVVDNANPGSSTRDVCVFGGELIVVDPAGLLHRFQADAKTPIMPDVTITGTPGACASDGAHLYVSHYVSPDPTSEIVVFDKGANGPTQVGTIQLPNSLLDAGYIHLVDFAYVKKGGLFVGLFTMSGGVPDSQLNGDVMAPFGLDGGAGPFIDGGVWHGVGEFLP